MPRDIPCQLVIWRLSDGKPGHEKQTLGLAEALGRLIPCQRFDIPVRGRGTSLLDWITGRFPAASGLPAPDLILAAGHATHPAALAARRTHGGRIVVLMRPSLPLSWFDLCLVPEHDAPPARPDVIATRGVLNAVRPGADRTPDRGLILIGGPSAHFQWDDADVAAQVRAVAEATPGVRWQVTDSRRTPAGFLAGLKPASNLELRPHSTTPPGWLEAALAGAGQAWVTEDSVSMIYEALTAGCAVGLLRLPGGGDSRIRRGIECLLRDQWLTEFAAWRRGAPLPPPPGHFDEARRCAKEIIDRWFPNAN